MTAPRSKEDIQKRLNEIETAMNAADFWADKAKAQAMLRERESLLIEAEGGSRYDAGAAILNLYAGAGGDDAEDFVRMLLDMYRAFFAKKGWTLSVLSESKNNGNGYRNLSLEVKGKGVYGVMRNESGVHRLVRMSPFSSKGLRHTSFALVEFLPAFDEVPSDIELNPADLNIEFAKAGGPGGQNVNKRETAVRIVHTPTNISVHVTSERSQGQNRQKALEIIAAKLYAKREEDQKRLARGLSIAKSTDIEWGSQIRSYVLHPYQLIKDHRTDVEERNVDKVLEEGALEVFLDAEKSL